MKELNPEEEYYKEIKEALDDGIQDAIVEIRERKAQDRCKSLSRLNPKKVAKILHLAALGVSQTMMVTKYKLNRSTIISVLTDYSDFIGRFRELGSKLAARSYLNLESLEEDLVESLRRKLQAGYDPEFKDLKEVSIAKSNSQRQAMTTRGEVSNITEERKVYTQDDYEATVKAAKKRIQEAKQAEVIDVVDNK